MTGSAPPEKSEVAREERLRAMFAAADPPVKASEALRQRVAGVTTAAAPHASKRRERSRPGAGSWTPLRIGMCLAGAAAVASIALGVVPTLVAAQALRRMQAVISDARSMHDIAWRINPDGSRTKIHEVWYQAGRWRIESRRHGQIQVFADRKLWTYDRQLNQLTVKPAEGPATYNPSGFSMAAMTSDFARWGWNMRIRLLEDITVAGRRAYQVTIEQARQPGRLLMLVDAATDLPIRNESQLERDGRWMTQMLSEPRYNDPLPAALFEPRFPKSAQILEPVRDRRIWEQRLRPGIGRKHVGDRDIVIRDLQVNAEGDLFLLYTAGALPDDKWDDWSVELTDEFGTRYLPGEGFTAYSHGINTPENAGYLFDGQKLEGRWWVPVVPQTPWRPRRVTLTFHVQPVTHHGPDPVPVENYSASTSFTLRVSRPATELVPRYMPFMNYGLEEREARIQAARARAWFYRNTGSTPDLEKALALYREVIRLREEQSQDAEQHIYDSQSWLAVGEVLRDLGRKDEARAAFETAIRETLSPDEVSRRAEEALRSFR